MGFFSKVFKGIKKVAKKIGKGIKKIGKKLFGAIGKIGPLGQLALMFIGVPPIFGRMMGAVGSFVQSVAPNVYKAFTAIKGAAQGAFNTITEGIGNGIDRVMNFTKGKGFNLSGDRTSIFGGVSAKDIKVPEVGDASSIFKEGTLELKESTLGDRLMANVDPTTVTAGPQAPFTGDIDILGSTISGSPADLGTAMGTKGADILTTDVTKSILAPTDVSDITDATLDFRIPDATSTTEKTAKSFMGITSEDVKERVGLAALDVGQAQLTAAGAPDLPTQKVMHSQLSDFIMPITNQQRLLDSTTWNGINSSYQQAGAYGGAAQGDLLSMYYNNQFANDTQYQQDMRRLGAFTL